MSCAVLDLDSTLIHVFGHIGNLDNAHSYVKNDRIIQVDLKDEFMWGTKRPHVEKFLEKCFDIFDMVIVWSAGTKDYVDKIVEIIFQKKKPHHVFSRYDCLTYVTSEGDNIRQKPLSLLSQRVPEIDLKRTLIFDDYQDVCEQDMLNHIHIKPWEGEFETLTKRDSELLNLIKWISELPKYSNYREIRIKRIERDGICSTKTK